MGWRISIVGRLLVYASLVAFLSFYLVGMEWPAGITRTLLKGAAVGLLAVLALIEGEGKDARRIAAIMALGAAGDMGIEYRLELGAALFLVGHLLAIRFYRSHARGQLSPSQKWLAIAVLTVVPVMSLALTHSLITLPYALGLAGMAAAAWTSRFSRYNVGLGAMLFVASDLLIFARLGPMSGNRNVELLIMPLYYLGQFLICLGVLRSFSMLNDTSRIG